MVQVALLLVFVASVSAFREIEFKNCKPVSGALACKIKNVKVQGCLTPSSWVDERGNIIVYDTPGNPKEPCRIDTGSPLNFSITFETGYVIDTVRSQFTLPEIPDCWRPLTGSQCPVNVTAEAGCDRTKCPLQPGIPQRYETTMTMNRAVPNRSVNDRRIYQLRWKLWSNKNKIQNCCFNMPVQY